MAGRKVFIFGGARSGKSFYAQELAKKMGSRVLYVATARALDAEMERRVAIHRASRPVEWDTLEAPVGLTEALRGKPIPYDAILLDCVTLLLSDAFCRVPGDAAETEYETAVEDVLTDLFAAMDSRLEPWILVSNEVGMGIVPETHLGRIFRDAQGRVNQKLAARADEVYFMAAGLALKMK